MPAEPQRGLTPHVTLLLATVALLVAFAATRTLSAEPTPDPAPAMLSAPRGPAVDLRLAAATVPKLQESPEPRTRRVQRVVRRVPPAPRVADVATPQPAPPPAVREQTPQPTPNPTPRRVAPAPRPVSPPVATPVATPVPTFEPAGEFDTTGEAP